MMKYLLFDRSAITRLISVAHFQSANKTEGKRLVDHFCSKSHSEIIENVIVKYLSDGIIFTMKSRGKDTSNDKINLFCVDLTVCRIMDEQSSPNDLLTVMQKSFRLAIKIWDRKPFSQSERIYESKSILFPFIIGDRRRIVVERSNHLPEFENTRVEQPLVAYKYSAEDPAMSDEKVDVTVLRKAIRDYLDNINQIKKEQKALIRPSVSKRTRQLNRVEMSQSVKCEGFQWMGYKQQYDMLTNDQKSIVDFETNGIPLRIEGPAGTGKTIAMIMRAYRLLRKKKELGESYRVIFISHNESTCRRCNELFASYQDAKYFMSQDSEQSIRFTTLLEYCRLVAEINSNNLLNSIPENVKDEQLQWILSALETSEKSIKTFQPLLSSNMKKFFDILETPVKVACKILQHEFSIQIKGRTDSTIESYKKIMPIKNGLPYEKEKDQELIFLLFSKYQADLSSLGVFDADDVVMEALARLNAPVWRRERREKGFDMVFVDEMHLFNLNEQSVFHFLTKLDVGNMDRHTGIPICFALDYGQAVGDQGDLSNDYLTKSFQNATLKNLDTVFRNSPSILQFCESIAASGTLMFQEDFRNSYSRKISKDKSQKIKNDKYPLPTLFMYEHEDAMLNSLREHIDRTIKELQCSPNEIIVIDFSDKIFSKEYLDRISENARRKIYKFLDEKEKDVDNGIVFASPYDVNGLEFQTVILMNVDAGYVPQKAGISDISKHFVTYSAYNLLYIAASRAKSRLILLGTKVNGVSSCLKYALSNGSLKGSTDEISKN